MSNAPIRTADSDSAASPTTANADKGRCKLTTQIQNCGPYDHFVAGCSLAFLALLIATATVAPPT